MSRLLKWAWHATGIAWSMHVLKALSQLDFPYAFIATLFVVLIYAMRPAS